MTTKIQTTMTKKSAKKTPALLRRPIAPPAPSKPPPPPKPKGIPFQVYTSQSIPSLLEMSEEFSEHHQMLAPSLPSNAPSVASDFVPEDVYAPQNTPRAKEPVMMRVSRSPSYQSSAGPSDWKYIIESRYNMKGSGAGRTLESQSLVKPYKPRGPDPFPLRQPKQLPEIRPEILYADADDPRYFEMPAFSLNDFCYDMSRVYCLPRDRIRNIVFSKQNFKKLTTLFATFSDRPKQEKIHKVELKGEDIPAVTPRVPQHQLLLEMATIIENQMREMMMGDVRGQISTIRGQRTTASASSVGTGSRQLAPIAGDKDSLFSAPASKYFQGARRSNEPFEESNSATQINPSELAILESLVNGGLALSLKAHFISSLPELTPLTNTLTYLNLSFNDFRIIPPEIFQLKNLRVLKLRNNPLRELPYEIDKLSKLRTLVVSFCLLSSVPLSLFTLPLKFLDLSYNKLSFLPNEFKQLRWLRELNLEGNQLAAMPCGMLKLRELRYLRVINNFMHPLFWKENSKNNPQRLSDLAATICKQEQLDHLEGLTDSMRVYLNSYTTCDCCGGPVYGPGLRVIRPCSKAFGVKHLPFLFISCSPQCRKDFMTNTESLTDLLYEDDSDEYDDE